MAPMACKVAWCLRIEPAGFTGSCVHKVQLYLTEGSERAKTAPRLPRFSRELPAMRPLSKPGGGGKKGGKKTTCCAGRGCKHYNKERRTARTTGAQGVDCQRCGKRVCCRECLQPHMEKCMAKAQAKTAKSMGKMAAQQVLKQTEKFKLLLQVTFRRLGCMHALMPLQACPSWHHSLFDNARSPALLALRTGGADPHHLLRSGRQHAGC